MARPLIGRFGPACETLSHQEKPLDRLLPRSQRGKCRELSSFHQGHSSSVGGIHPNVLTQAQLSRLHVSQYHNIRARPRPLLLADGNLSMTSHREMSMLLRVVSGFGRFLKVRYLLLIGGAGGGVAASQQIDKVKSYIPDTGWIKEYIPESDWLKKRMPDPEWIKEHLPDGEIFRDVMPDWRSWHVGERAAKSVSRWRNEIQERIPEKGWLKNKLRELPAVAPSLQELKEKVKANIPADITATVVEEYDAASLNIRLGGGTSSADVPSKKDEASRQRIQEEVMEIQLKYQKEIERLEKDNRELRKQLLLRGPKTGPRPRAMKKSLIDMYSEVLDELNQFDSSYNTQDNLPRVVVVGDQSSGKTSVLEMVAQARIFPRGSGQMMTRSPVKVTLSEGPYHVAQFRDSAREYDLTKESDLAALRKEVELRMKNSVNAGQTVTSKCISMSVKGPGLQRMVLVDLPGIISTVTTEMASDTRECIRAMCKQYMENPNSIILCIQDGSLDAERSNVTDLVSSMDPQGRRTIFVLTKVDLAESSLYDPQRIKRIMDGRLFPMKALGYFAVVTGKGNNNDGIQTIKQYEEDFFRSSRLFKDGILKPTQMTTQNLSLAVSETFWKMVKETVEQQADAFKATRFNLETEWKNTYPRLRELDRDELFEKAKSEILDEVVNLSQVTSREWEEAFHKKLWEKTGTYVIENVYLPAAQTKDIGTFNTAVDIKLRQWADQQLPKKCVEIGWDTLHSEFAALLESCKKSKEYDQVFDPLKTAIIQMSKGRHCWEPKAEESLRVIQLNTLEDRSVNDKEQWHKAVNFMEETMKSQLEQVDRELAKQTGPSTVTQWLKWTHRTEDHLRYGAIRMELQKVLNMQPDHKSCLAPDELTTVKRNLLNQSYDVDSEMIRKTWFNVYRRHFYQQSLQQAHDCRKGFYYYQKGFQEHGLNCNAVVLFWRLQRMLDITSNALRQQVVNNEARRLERIIKEVLDDVGEDKEILTQLLTGRRVLLAEELKKVRHIQDKLEEFIQALNNEK